MVLHFYRALWAPQLWLPHSRPLGLSHPAYILDPTPTTGSPVPVPARPQQCWVSAVHSSATGPARLDLHTSTHRSPAQDGLDSTSGRWWGLGPALTNSVGSPHSLQPHRSLLALVVSWDVKEQPRGWIKLGMFQSVKGSRSYWVIHM